MTDPGLFPEPKTEWPVVCATGHRRIPKKAEAWVRDELARICDKLRDRHGTRTGVSGMALGADQIWANAVLLAGLRLHACIPFPAQPDGWTPYQQNHWEALRFGADEVEYVSDQDPSDRTSAARLLHARNDRMLAISQAVVAIWEPENRRGSGTYSALVKAHRRRMPVIWLNPTTCRTTIPTLDRWEHLLTA